jgi:redox-sensitive bicupin YhaK (pirin superfamily)
MLERMITVRPSDARGHSDHGWLDSRHTFSFSDYVDPKHMGVSQLRVINDDRVAPGQGFGTHAHRDMEIISYVLEGALEHKDSLGTGSIIVPGDVQRMSAGTGVRHSEFNPSKAEPVHFLQIWILPARTGLPPSYEQKTFPAEERRARFRLIASPDARAGSVTVHQDVLVYAALLEPGEQSAVDLLPGRQAWLHVARGEVTLGDHRLREGDGVHVQGESSIAVTATSSAEVLLFDLP